MKAETERKRERRRQRPGHQARACQVPRAAGRRVSEGALTGSDRREAGGTHNQGPGCRQGHLPCRTGQGGGAGFQAAQSSAAHPGTDPGQARLPRHQGRTQLLFMPTETGILGAAGAWAARAADKGAFRWSHRRHLYLAGSPGGATARARPDRRPTRGSQRRATPIRTAANPFLAKPFGRRAVLSRPGGPGSGRGPEPGAPTPSRSERSRWGPIHGYPWGTTPGSGLKVCHWSFTMYARGRLSQGLGARQHGFGPWLCRSQAVWR